VRTLKSFRYILSQKIVFITKSARQAYRELFPVIQHQASLLDLGLKIIIHGTSDLEQIEGFDHVFLMNRSFVPLPDDLRFLKDLKSKNRFVYWFDQTDSSGTTNFEVIPFVDLYLKRAILGDLALYRYRYYRDRIFSDFYHSKFDIEDEAPFWTKQLLPKEHENKVRLCWNEVFTDHRQLGKFLHFFTRRFHPLLFWKGGYSVLPFEERSIDVFARMSSSYPANTISFQRKTILKRLKNFKFLENKQVEMEGKIPPAIYQEQLEHSKVVISPFGWGELCYRDVQAFRVGAALLKPDVSHLKTWPDVLSGNYLPISWDFSDLEEKLEYLLDSPQECEEMAARGNESLMKYHGEQGKIAFVQQFKNLLLS
jgi:hypothetical protein